MEQPRVQALIELLERSRKEPYEIIQILSSIIQQQMMYGGALEDKLIFHIEEIKRKSLKNMTVTITPIIR